MNALAGGMAGWGAGFLPPLVAAALLTLSGLAPAETTRHPIVAVGALSAASLGLLGALMGLSSGRRDDPSSVAVAALAGGFLPGLLCMQGLVVALIAPEPWLWLAGLIVFFLPGPVAAGAAAWIRMRTSHGTS